MSGSTDMDLFEKAGLIGVVMKLAPLTGGDNDVSWRVNSKIKRNIRLDRYDLTARLADDAAAGASRHKELPPVLMVLWLNTYAVKWSPRGTGVPAPAPPDAEKDLWLLTL